MAKGDFKVYVKELHGVTIEYLESLKERTDVERNKLHIDAILMSIDKKTVSQISEKLWIHQDTVYNYIHSWNHSGLYSLRFIEFMQTQDGEVFRFLKRIVFEFPPINERKWTVPMLRDCINEEFKTNYTYYKIRTMLCTLGGIRALKAELAKKISETALTCG